MHTHLHKIPCTQTATNDHEFVQYVAKSKISPHYVYIRSAIDVVIALNIWNALVALYVLLYGCGS